MDMKYITIEDLRERDIFEKDIRYFAKKGYDKIDWDNVTEIRDGRGGLFCEIAREFKLTLKIFFREDGYWCEYIYDPKNRKLTFHVREGYWEESIYDENGNEIKCIAGEGYGRKEI